MASSYPGSLDSFTNPSSTDAMDASAALYHDVQHANVNDAIEAVQAELGTDPAGAQSTVKARLEASDAGLSPVSAGWPVDTGIYEGNGSPAATSTRSGAANYQYYVPWWCPRSVTLDRIGVEVTTFQADANARLGIYSPTSAGMPGTLLLDAGEIDCSSNGSKLLTINQALSAGLYWFALLNETASVVYRAVATTSCRRIGAGNSATGGPSTYVGEAQTYTSGLLSSASAFGSLDWSVSAPIQFAVRRSA